MKTFKLKVLAKDHLDRILEYWLVAEYSSNAPHKLVPNYDDDPIDDVYADVEYVGLEEDKTRATSFPIEEIKYWITEAKVQAKYEEIHIFKTIYFVDNKEFYSWKSVVKKA